MRLSLSLLACLFGCIKSTHAIKNGEFDNDGHPYVGLMVALNATGYPLWRCSGSLLSKNIFLTAGHCVEPPAVQATIWFDADVENGIPDNGYPFTGNVTGNVTLHPDYNSGAFFLHDLGIVELEGDGISMSEYAMLPDVGELNTLDDEMPRGQITFTSVGYGLQEINPVFIESDRIRQVAYPRLIQINTPGFTGDFSILLSNNHATGGTCFGDSGGPNFLFDTNVIAGVTSYGINGNCAGTGGVYRIDTVDDLAWVNSFL